MIENIPAYVRSMFGGQHPLTVDDLGQYGYRVTMTDLSGKSHSAILPLDSTGMRIRYTMTAISRVVTKRNSDIELERAWKRFGDIPVDNNDDIQEEFSVRSHDLHYPVGTDRFEIWHDFDRLHTKGVAYIMGLTSDE